MTLFYLLYLNAYNFRILNTVCLRPQKVDFFQSTAKPCGPAGNFAIFCIVCYGRTEGKNSRSGFGVTCPWSNFPLRFTTRVMGTLCVTCNVLIDGFQRMTKTSYTALLPRFKGNSHMIKVFEQHYSYICIVNPTHKILHQSQKLWRRNLQKW